MHSLRRARSTRKAALFIAAGLSALAAPKAAAQDATPWVVAESHGDATQQVTDGAALPVAAGTVLAEGASVRTGADGRIVVAHGNDRLTMSADSAFSVPRGADPATGPSILQTLGTLLFKVEHTPGRRFEVDTPYLAAVVKGTVFTVSIDGGAQIVHVAEGAVEVSAALSHDAVLIRPGQTAMLSSPSGTPTIIDAHPSSGEPDRKSQRGDVAPGDKPADVASEPANAAPDKSADGRREGLTRTLGSQPFDVSTLTNGLVKPGKDLQMRGGMPASSDPLMEAAPAPSVPSAIQSAPIGQSASSGGEVVGAAGAKPNVPLAGAPLPATPVTAPVPLPVNVPNPHSAAPSAFAPGPNSPAATGRKP